MPTVTIQPTSNETPDTGQGGSAVTGNSNTGHASTLSDAFDGSTVTKTCRWFAFPAGAGVASATLKITHSSQGNLVGDGAHNTFTLSYSLNNGSNWTNVVSRSDFTSLESGTASVTLTLPQDFTVVQVRDFIQSVTASAGETADTTVAISNIQIEAVTSNSQPIAIM